MTVKIPAVNVFIVNDGCLCSIPSDATVWERLNLAEMYSCLGCRFDHGGKMPEVWSIDNDELKDIIMEFRFCPTCGRRFLYSKGKPIIIERTTK